jgi:hypothetical protein
VPDIRARIAWTPSVWFRKKLQWMSLNLPQSILRFFIINIAIACYGCVKIPFYISQFRHKMASFSNNRQDRMSEVYVPFLIRRLGDSSLEKCLTCRQLIPPILLRFLCLGGDLFIFYTRRNNS